MGNFRPMIITGPNPPDADTVIHLSTATKTVLAALYWIWGWAAVSALAIGIGSLAASIRVLLRGSLLGLVAMLCLCAVCLGIVQGLIMLSGIIGDRTFYKGQFFLLVGGIIGIPTALTMGVLPFVKAGEYLQKPGYKPFGYIFGAVLMVGGLSAMLIVSLMFLAGDSSPLTLLAATLLFPVTALLTPLVMAFGHGMFWSLLLYLVTVAGIAVTAVCEDGR